MAALLPIPRMRDPQKQYVRQLRSGKFQARPWKDGERHNLGLFPNWNAARKAVIEFFEGNREAKPKYLMPIYHGINRSCVRYYRMVPTAAARDGTDGNRKKIIYKPIETTSPRKDSVPDTKQKNKKRPV